jgi:hypothetical protein
MLKSISSRDMSSPPLAKNEIFKTLEFRAQSGPMKDVEMQETCPRKEPEIYYGSSFTSNNNSVAWADVDWRGNGDEEQNTSTVRHMHTCSTVHRGAFDPAGSGSVAPSLKIELRKPQLSTACMYHTSESGFLRTTPGTRIFGQ